MRRASIAIAIATAAMLACQSPAQGNHGSSSAQVVLDRFDTIPDGANNSYKVLAGTYRLQLTATSDGASIRWIGGACPGATKMKVFDGNCVLSQDGQLEIGNPSHFGLGTSISVTVKLRRL